MAESTVVACPNCGKKYKIAADKLGRTFKCTGCETRFQAGAESRPVPPPPPPPPPVEVESSSGEDETTYDPSSETAPVAPMPNYNTGGMSKPKASGMAIASLICGILICLAPLTSVLALIFGFLGLNKTKQGMGGRWMSIAGIALGIFGLLLAAAAVVLLPPALNKARQAANRTRCEIHMKQIATALGDYQSQNQGEYPPDLTTLWKNQRSLDGSMFVCPETRDTPAATYSQLESGGHLSYKYIYPGSGATHDRTQVILYDNPTNHEGEGSNLGFADGHVQWYGSAEATLLIAKSRKH